MCKAFYIAVGSELITFKLNKYLPLISKKLSEIGIEIIGEITIKDNLQSLINAIKFASNQSEIIITTGGLGPTKDDLTRQAISKFLNIPLVFSKTVAKSLAKYGDIKKNDYLKNQCYIIKNAKIIENKNGTAQGEIIKSKEKIYILLPGPLNEWEPMWGEVKEYLSSFNKDKNIYSATIKIADLKESDVENMIANVIYKFKKSLDYNILAGPNIVELNFRSRSNDVIETVKKEVNNILRENIYSYENEKLEEVLGKSLIQKGLTLSSAESCTGGLLASKITDIPGSSKYYIGGVNAYSNEVKIKLLGVKKETLHKYGAVSEETAIEMVKGIKKLLRSDCSIAITGIAGPGGGSRAKPVGTVFIAISVNNKIKTLKKNFTAKDRAFIKNASANTAMWTLYKMIK